MAPVTAGGKFLRKASILIRLAVAIGFSSQLCSQAADGFLDYQVEAVFLLNFTKFIEWPAKAFELPDSPVTICILGDDPFGATLSQIVGGEVVNGRRVAVQRIKRAPAPKSCQVLFWRKPEKPVKGLSDVGPGVLTVGEGENFVHEGGMIGFVIDNRHVRFDIDQAAAERAGLKLSSKLLSVARSVGK